jgi:hypothetical protein
MSRLTCRLSGVTYVLNPDTVGRANVMSRDTVGRAKATLVGSASASPWAYADGVSLTDTISLPVTTIWS